MRTRREIQHRTFSAPSYTAGFGTKEERENWDLVSFMDEMVVLFLRRFMIRSVFNMSQYLRLWICFFDFFAILARRVAH